jgi:GT2 family glycosyltransferase
MSQYRICAILPTRNRKALLQECLQALKAQTHPVAHIIVVDNASTDGSAELAAREGAEVVQFERNLGGAAGFHEGIRRAYCGGYDWVWIMDDDTIPQPDALAELLEAVPRLERLGRPPAVLASRVLWQDGGVHPMNWSWPNPFPYRRFRAARRMGYVPVRWAAFSSVLVARWAIHKYGLPHRDYFVRTDDLEYTGRILRREAGYLVPKSLAVHKTPTKYTPASAHPERFYYEVRNRIWAIRSRSFGVLGKAALGVHIMGSTLVYLAKNRPALGLRVVWKGLVDGLATAPDHRATILPQLSEPDRSVD